MRLFIRTAAFLLACAAALFAQPLRLHPENPHYFEYRGKALALITSAEHYGAVLNGEFDYRRYLSALAADKLNYTRIFGGSYVEAPGQSFGIRRNTLAPNPDKFVAPWMRSTVPGYAGGGNKFDLQQWNTAFFDRYRAFLSEAARHGILVEITFFTSQYGDPQWRLSPFHAANNVNATDAIDRRAVNTLENGNILAHQERYVRKLVAEANEFDNVFFEIQNEPWSDRPVLAGTVNPYLQGQARDQYPNSIDLADAQSVAWQARVAEWVRDEESKMPKKHLIAQNYCNFGWPVRDLVPGADIVNFHYAYPEAASANYGLGKALVYDETGFMGREDTAYLRQAWNFLLSGGGGFNNLDYSFTTGREDGSDIEPNGPGGGSPALRRQLRVLSEFLNSFSLAGLRPGGSAVKHSAGAYARVLANPGREYAIYLDGAGPVTLVLNLPAGSYRSEWLHPETGALSGAANWTVREGDEHRLESPAYRSGMGLRIVRVPR